MKLKTIAALAAAGTFAWSAGANANWFGSHFGSFKGDRHAASSTWNGYEVQTPVSVNESAPWRAREGHLPMASFNSQSSYGSTSFGSTEYGSAPYATGSTHGSGSGSGSFASSAQTIDMSSRGPMSSMSFADRSFGSSAGTPYWLLGE